MLHVSQLSGPNTPSPSGSGSPQDGAAINGNVEKVEPQPAKDVYTTETETHTPSKEEIETNEKNLQHSASYLGQLVFKLR